MRKAIEASAMFAVSSVAMILLNKGLAKHMHGNAPIVILIQNLATVGLLKWTKQDLGFSFDVAFKWLPCAILFTANILSSIISLAYISVPTFTVFRNTQPIIATVLDYTLRSESTDIRSILCLFIILTGAYVYAINDIEFHITGYMWASVHVVSMSFYSVAVKSRIQTMKLEAYEMSWYNNLIGNYILGMIILYDLESIVRFSDRFNMESWTLLGFSSLGGFCVSVSGFMAQEHLSPTSWLTLNNLSKIPAIVIACYLWKLQLSTIEITGMATSIFGGYLYSLSKQKAKEAQESQV